MQMLSVEKIFMLEYSSRICDSLNSCHKEFTAHHEGLNVRALIDHVLFLIFF